MRGDASSFTFLSNVFAGNCIYARFSAKSNQWASTARRAGWVLTSGVQDQKSGVRLTEKAPCPLWATFFCRPEGIPLNQDFLPIQGRRPRGPRGEFVLGREEVLPPPPLNGGRAGPVPPRLGPPARPGPEGRFGLPAWLPPARDPPLPPPRYPLPEVCSRPGKDDLPVPAGLSGLEGRSVRVGPCVRVESNRACGGAGPRLGFSTGPRLSSRSSNRGRFP